ncbi:MAG TPA: DUF1360 domain-containing protein [Nocardioidaceae bacterium]|jgi:hypothetical protein|nr:DUF1360 domain-containing protein [Nocardioidaceae bacterium]
MTDSPREPARVASYLGAMTAFATGALGLAVAGRVTGRSLPERYDVADLVIGGMATYKFARLISKDAVTTPIRAPFTEFKENAGSAEVNEEPRDGHAIHTIGELISCPFCLAPWISTGYVAALSLSPRLARTWAAVFSIVGTSDALQQVYGRVRTD